MPGANTPKDSSETSSSAAGRIVDETGERRADVLVREGRVVAVEPSIEPPNGATVLDAGGCFVSPGLVDLHAHLREPGGEIAETVESGSQRRSPGRLHGTCRDAQHRARHRLGSRRP